MKMIMAIVNDERHQQISQTLLSANYRVTQLATTSGFLRGGETTLMIGVNDDQVDEALLIIREQISASQDPDKKRATIYVLNVKNFYRL
jgi:uncharacterized protein YaaQ